MARTRVIAAALAALVAANTLSACSLGDRKAQAEAIIASVALARAEGTAKGTTTWKVKIEALPDLLEGAQFVGVKEGFEVGPLQFLSNVDLARERADLALVAGQSGVLFDRTQIYLRRAPTSGGRSSRPWSRLDVEALDDRKDPGIEQVATALFNAPFLVNPNHVLDLLTGALTGSVRQLGHVDLDGVDTVHYRFNISVDKAESELDLDEPERDARRRMLQTLAIKSDVIAGEAWFDSQRRPRQVVLHLVSKPAPKTRFNTDLGVRLTEFGTEVDSTPPPKAQVLNVETVSEFIRYIDFGPGG